MTQTETNDPGRMRKMFDAGYIMASRRHGVEFVHPTRRTCIKNEKRKSMAKKTRE